jgi:hypothetical protein
MRALCIDPLPHGRENAADPMPTLHRRALLTAAAAILTAPRPGAAFEKILAQNFLRYAREVWGR